MLNILFYIGGLLLVVGAVLPVVPGAEGIAAPIYAIGCVLYALIQIRQSYDGANIQVKRLRRQQIISDVLLIISAVLMLCYAYQLAPIGSGEWKIVLLVAVIQQIYTAFRIPAALSGEDKHQKA